MRARQLLPALALLSGCAAFLGQMRLADDEGDRIRVPHARHAAAKIECLTCHESLYDQTDLAAGDALPTEKICLQCHGDKKEKGECASCHTDVKKAKHFKQGVPSIHMSHAKHIELVKEDCSRCHTKLPGEVANQVGALAPAMAACRGCHRHEEQFQEGRCEVCHTDLTKYPTRPVSTAFSHAPGFVRSHQNVARTSPETCARCHDQTFCADCHANTSHPRIEIKQSEAVEREFIHRGDFLGRHSVEARVDPVSCRKCHGESFCADCHTSQNLTPHSASPRDPHPAGWTLPGSASFHGPAARRDIASCAPCHDQGPRTVCIDCHKVGGAGGDPHPLGWAGRHSRDEIQTNGMCRYCHL